MNINEFAESVIKKHVILSENGFGLKEKMTVSTMKMNVRMKNSFNTLSTNQNFWR